MNREGGPAAPLFFLTRLGLLLLSSSLVFFFGLLLLFWRLDQAADVCTDKVCRHSLLVFFSSSLFSLLLFSSSSIASNDWAVWSEFHI